MNKFHKALHQLDYFIGQKMQEYHTPGLAIAITDREQLLHISTYGKADIAADLPVTPETLFPIASISKSFTSIALLQLSEAGQLDLHAPVTQYLPWFGVKSVYEPITIHHLLSHTAGIITGRDFTHRSPERIKFDSMISDRALRANVSGCDYYRTFSSNN